MGKSSGNYDDINGGIDIVVADAGIGIGIDIEDEIAFYGFVLCVVRTVKPPTSTFDPIEILICISARSKKTMLLRLKCPSCKFRLNHAFDREWVWQVGDETCASRRTNACQGPGIEPRPWLFEHKWGKAGRARKRKLMMTRRSSR